MLPPAKSYYHNEAWDTDSWVKVIAIEYESLVARFPFRRDLKSPSNGRPIRVLDVGCGTAIFPRYLDRELDDGLPLICDLLDISKASLQAAERTLETLRHFSPRRKIHLAIEDIPEAFTNQTGAYDVIWAIHSFTTVDVKAMNAVYERLYELLAATGSLCVYQLTKSSSYQMLHTYYRQVHPNGYGAQPYMEYEDSVAILAELGLTHETHALSFEHVVEAEREDLLAKYLRKCVLDDSVAAPEFFLPILDQFYDAESDSFRFPQQVNLIVLRKG